MFLQGLGREPAKEGFQGLLDTISGISSDSILLVFVNRMDLEGVEAKMQRATNVL